MKGSESEITQRGLKSVGRRQVKKIKVTLEFPTRHHESGKTGPECGLGGLAAGRKKRDQA